MRKFSGVRWVLIAQLVLIISLFVAQASALWQHRVDYPIVDDWRYYSVESGASMPESLNFEWLLRPSKDTLSITGKWLDWALFRGISHDYHLLAMSSFLIFFGAWLACALALVLTASWQRPVPLLAGLAVFLLPLAGVPFWVTTSPLQHLEPAIAYHQMLPVVGLVAVSLLFVMVAAGEGRRATIPAVALCAFFGLAYNSGAFALFVMGGTMLAISALCRARGEDILQPLPRFAAAVTLTSALCLALHILAPLLKLGINPVVEARGKGVSMLFRTRANSGITSLGSSTAPRDHWRSAGRLICAE